MHTLSESWAVRGTGSVREAQADHGDPAVHGHPEAQGRAATAEVRFPAARTPCARRREPTPGVGLRFGLGSRPGTAGKQASPCMDIPT